MTFDWHSVNQDKEIGKYLDGASVLKQRDRLLKPKKGICQPRLRLIDTKIDNVVEKEREKLSDLPSEKSVFLSEEKDSPELAKKLNVYKKGQLNQFVNWKDVEVQEKEALEFEKSCSFGGIYIDQRFSQPEVMMNKKILFPAEQNAIQYYTSLAYLLINGTLSNDEVSINQWMEINTNMGNLQEGLLKKNQSLVPQIAKMIASGLNKIPSYVGEIYRGDALPLESINEWKNGKIMITNKFFSCSPLVDICERFAMSSAQDYMNELGKPYKPVLYVFDSKSSKNISKYSANPREDERIYLPGQAFRSIAVDEKSVPGLAIIFLEEMN